VGGLDGALHEFNGAIAGFYVNSGGGVRDALWYL
jgi:hypothetical protein